MASVRAASAALFLFQALAPAQTVEPREITFESLFSGQTKATWVAAPGQKKSPGILYVHWYEPRSKTSNRTQFLEEAQEMARRGASGLLVDTPWSDPSWFRTRNEADDFKNSIRQVQELRWAMYFLSGQPGVDKRNLYYVGHDFGAMYGAALAPALAGTKSKVRAWALQAGTTDFADWFLISTRRSAEESRAFREEIAVLAPVRLIGKAAPAPVLLQFGKADPYVPLDKARDLFDAAREPKEALYYDAGHELNEQAVRDRIEWLTRQIQASQRKRK